MRGARGFTLLELVVVLGIFAVLSVMAYGGLSSVLTTRERVAASLERTAALQKAFLRLRNDFQQLRARPARDGYGEMQPALLTRRDGVLEFTRSGWRNPLAQPRSTLERVSYRLEERRLLRENWRAVDRAQDIEPAQVVVLDGVEELRWRFLDGALEWQDEWPRPNATGQIDRTCVPRAVELSFVADGLGPVRLLFSAVNNVPATAGGPGQSAPTTSPPC